MTKITRFGLLLALITLLFVLPFGASANAEGSEPDNSTRIGGEDNFTNEGMITNFGTVGGTIFAEGGDSIDTFDVAFTGLTQQDIITLSAEDPANESFTFNGQTFNFTNFETITFSNYVAPALTQLAPNGTASATAIVTINDVSIASCEQSLIQG